MKIVFILVYSYLFSNAADKNSEFENRVKYYSPMPASNYILLRL